MTTLDPGGRSRQSVAGKPDTPASLGFRMPPEWHPHEATWLSWPKDPLTWPDRVPQVEAIFLRMIEVLAAHETVNVLVNDAEAETRVREMMVWPQSSNVRLHRVPTVDSWIRDYGPNFILRRDDVSPTGFELAYNDWGFNAWGGKYDTLMADDAVPAALAPVLGVRGFEPGLVLEGGAIDVNGTGVVMTTEQCLLNPNRNPGSTRAMIEQALRDYLGATEVLWLGEGVAGDDTDGHIDDIARFVSPTTIVTAVEQDPADVNYAPLQDNLRRLRLARDGSGRPYEIVSLPMPGPVLADGEPLPASYANFYIANGVVLLPVYGHTNDQQAADILQRVFPHRLVVPIDCEPLVWGMGAIHCVTQQQPRTADPLSPRAGKGSR
jgi:agmatine deiminase